MGEGTIAATMGQRKKLKHTEGSYLSNAVPQAACCVLHQQAERTAKAEPKNNNNDKKKKKKKIGMIQRKQSVTWKNLRVLKK